jgi:glycosyltransferase involved in cell wall biosynthesis
MAQRSRVILCVTNDLSFDQRLHKVCLSLQRAGYSPTLVGLRWSDTPQLSERTYETVRLRMRFRKGPLFYAESNLLFLVYLLRSAPDRITANDLDTLLPCRIAAWLMGVPLVYDAHEFFTEMPSLIGRPLTRWVWLSLERLLYPGIRAIMTVHEGIAALYQASYPSTPLPTVVPNLPLARPAPNPLPNREARLLLYQGALQHGRGIELALHALAQLPDVRLRVVGGDSHRPALEALAAQLGVSERVQWLGWVPFERLAALAMEASLGLSLEQAIGQSVTNSAPNKLYDYLQARLPIVVAPRPVHKDLVKRYGCGRVLKADTAEALATAISELLDNSTAYDAAQAGTERAAQELVWEAAEPRLIDVYHLAERTR